MRLTAPRDNTLRWERHLWSASEYAYTAKTVDGVGVAVIPHDGKWVTPARTGSLLHRSLARAQAACEEMAAHRGPQCACGGGIYHFTELDKDGYLGIGCDRFGVFPSTRATCDQLRREVTRYERNYR